MRPVAANIDQVLIVIAPEPEPIENLIDRYLIAIALSNMEAVLVLNKCELSDDSEHSLDDLLTVYRDIDIPVLKVSAETGENIETLREQLTGNTSVLVGQSGVGKSSLINALAPELALKTGELSEYATKGTHTTTTALLCHLPDGGTIIDSPGIREFHLWHITEQDVIAGFPEFHEYTDNCKFRNCAHQDDEGCALQQAWEDGKLHPSRWQSYWRIRQSLLEKP
jgi:ribosome biogenesis GTPase